MPVEYRPRDYQQAIINFMIENPRSNVWAGMGTGKTSATLTVLHFLLNVMGEDGPALILAPLRVASSTWPDEARKWSHLSNFRIVPVIGTAAERVAALKQKAHAYAINYDNLVWLVEHLGADWPFKIVVADESTRLKSFRLTQGGKRAQALGKVAHRHVQRFYNLTGSPAPNGVRDLWPQLWFIDEGARLGRSFSAFDQRWFATKRRPGQKFGGEVVLCAGAQAEIEDRLKDCTITVRASDFMDLPPLIENVIEVELPPLARRHYRELEREMFTKLAGGEEVEAFNAASLTMKCLQAANGALYVDDQGSWKEIHDAKLDALQSVVEEANGAPVLVAYHFKSDLARLRQAFPQGVALDADPGTVARWNSGAIPILFAHPASAGHGLNLQDGGNIIVFFGLWWDLEQHEQVIERIGPTRQAQSGYNRPVFVHRIIARSTVDEVVLKRLQTKASVQSLLLAAMKG